MPVYRKQQLAGLRGSFHPLVRKQLGNNFMKKSLLVAAAATASVLLTAPAAGAMT
jgi:hypothetical protein